MRIKCLGCGHNIELDSAYVNYDGQIRCNTCGAVLTVKIEDGEIKNTKVVSPSARTRWAGEPLGGER